MKIRVERHYRGLISDCKREDLVIRRVPHPNFADVSALIPEVTQPGCGVARHSLIQHEADRHSTSGSVAFSRAVLKVRRCECQRLVNVIRLELGVVSEKVIPVRIQRHGLYNSTDRQPRATYARLAVHLIRIPGIRSKPCIGSIRYFQAKRALATRRPACNIPV